MNTLSTLGLGLFLATFAQGCASTLAPSIDATLARQVQVGVSDRAQVQRWFGTPQEIEVSQRPDARCVESWYWGRPTGTTYENLTVRFDAQGHVCAHGYSGPARPRSPLAERSAEPSVAAHRAISMRRAIRTP